ncbi:MAG: thymidylate synthase [Tatlockia sp.]|jgi:thymidylate synthase|nr:thymidylate synthase [Tatlockia sp.]
MLPKLISKPNLSSAWAEALVYIIDNPGLEASPLVINIHNLEDSNPPEISSFRKALDHFLIDNNQQNVNTVANTIFPESLWLFADGDRQKLYDLYKKNLKRYKRLEPQKNKRGLYFERLISFGQNGPFDGNQLEFIISEFNNNPKNRRRSKFQASIFDPERDHLTTPRLGFPCLDHVSFVPNKKGITLNAFYAKQLLVEKGYGNYLGLYRLGNFMASQMNLKLTNLNCFIGVEGLGGSGITKACLSELSNTAREILEV